MQLHKLTRNKRDFVLRFLSLPVLLLSVELLFQIVFIPISQIFGLIYKNKFDELGMSAADGSTIINLNAALRNILGLVNGALIRLYGCRKVAIASAVLFTTGIILTSFANSFIQFVITYGLITC